MKSFLAVAVLVVFSLITPSMAKAATVAALPVTPLDDFDGAGITHLIDGTASLKASIDATYIGDLTPGLFSGSLKSRIYWDSGLNDIFGDADDKTHVVYIMEHDDNGANTIVLRELDVVDAFVANDLNIADIIQSGYLASLASTAGAALTGPGLESINTDTGAFNAIDFNWADTNGFIDAGESVAVYLTYSGLRPWTVFDGRTKDSGNISAFEDVLGVAVPEPTTALLLGASLIGIARAKRKKNRKQNQV